MELLIEYQKEVIYLRIEDEDRNQSKTYSYDYIQKEKNWICEKEHSSDLISGLFLFLLFEKKSLVLMHQTIHNISADHFDQILERFKWSDENERITDIKSKFT